MSKRANPALVGSFVILGILLLFVAILLFGSGKLFKGSEAYVLHFPNVNGLAIGAPVKFKGVPIGQVTDIRIHNDRPNKDEAIAVILEIEDQYLDVKSNPGNLNIKTRADFEAEIKNGLSAKLEMISLLTGLLYIELDYVTNEELREERLLKFSSHSSNKDSDPTALKEIPTIRSGLEELQQNVTVLLSDMSTVIKDLHDKLDQFEFEKLNDSLINATDGLDKLLNAEEISGALKKVNPILANVEKFTERLSTQVDPLAGSVVKSLNSMQQSLNALTAMVDDRSAFRINLDEALKDLSDAADSVQILVEYLERNPNAVISGKAQKED